MELPRTCLQELRYAGRNLVKSRGFTAVAAITLTTGIGAHTAIFSIIDTILLRPLPFRNPGHYPYCRPGFRGLESRSKSFQDMALFGWAGDMNMSGEGRPDHVPVVPTEANFFCPARHQSHDWPHLDCGRRSAG